MTDFTTWLLDVGYDRIFRMWKYRRMFTPYEQEMKFTDESEYEDTYATHIKIKEAIELPDGDILLGYQTIYQYSDLDEENPIIKYTKLSDMTIEYFPQDMEEEAWD